MAYATQLVRSSLLRPPSAVPHAAAGLLGLVLCLLVYQAPTTYRLDLAAADPALLTGFGQAEENEGGGFRWMASRAAIPLPPVGAPATLRITAIGWRPNDLPTPTLQASLDDRPLGAWPTTRADGVYEAPVPRQWLAPTGGVLVLRSDTFTPGAQDRRRLGVAVRSVELIVPGAGRGPVWPPLAVLALSATLPPLLLRAARHLGLAGGPSLALVAAALLVLAALAMRDRAGWLLAAPPVVLGLCGLAVAVATVPPLTRRTLPALGRLASAVRQGRLPEWPAAEVVTADLTAAQRRLVRLAVATLALGLLLAHLLSWFAPVEAEPWQTTAWGLRYIYSLPAWAPLLLALPVALLAVPAVSAGGWTWLTRGLAGPVGWLRRRNPYLLAGVGGLAVLPVLWLLRANNDRFGDSAEIQRKIAYESAIWREREPLDFFLHVKLYWALTPFTGWDVATVYAVLSCLAGGLFLTTLVLLAGLLARRPTDRLLAAALIGTGGFVQLFFGYLESYTLVTAQLAIVLLLGLLCLAGRLGVGWPATALAIAALLHPIAITAAPALAVLVLHRWQRCRYRWRMVPRLLLPTVTGLVVPVLLLVALFVANGYDMERWEIARNQFGGGDQRTFKPLLTVSALREYYPVLSLDHLRAVLNQHLLAAPLGWPLALTLLAVRRPAGLWRDPRFAFLLLAALGPALFTALWNPDLGPRQDWDLLSIGALPAVTLAAFLLVRLVPRDDRRSGGLLLLAVNLFHTGLWVLSNSQLMAP